MIPSNPRRYTTPYGSSSSVNPTSNSTSLSREKSFANEANSAEQMRMAHLKEERDRAGREISKGKLQDRQRRLQRDNAEIRSLELEIRRLNDESVRLRRELEDAQKKVNEVDLLEKKSQSEVEVVNKGIGEASTKISLLEKKSSEDLIKIQRSKAESQKIQDQINMLEAELNKAKQDLANKARELSQATSNISKFNDEWHAHQAVLIQKKKIAEQKEFEVKKHESEKAFKLRELETKKRALSELDTKKHNLELQLQQLKMDSEAMARDVRQLLHS